MFGLTVWLRIRLVSQRVSPDGVQVQVSAVVGSATHPMHQLLATCEDVRRACHRRAMLPCGMMQRSSAASLHNNRLLGSQSNAKGYKHQADHTIKQCAKAFALGKGVCQLHPAHNQHAQIQHADALHDEA
ncbi:hypothetical protein MOLA814_01297 [Betaproteobacteria bacterium MOLA814]|nr:hypothetical protein MOLA814_01297 [Betaproteobacteria bacterium MOLA814]